jgi:ABC-2 type transport system ATP-binding protein
MNVAPITCSDLTKRFGSLIALESVNFVLEKPGVVGLVGPNGSGKSTLLRLLMGALKPSSGEVHLYGHAPRESRLRYTNVGYLSASDRMFPELTVLENMIYRGRLYGLDHQQGSTMAARLLRERNLYSLRDRRPDTLSTGQRRQVSLLSVLMHQPKILLLDEPTTGIDITAISQIYQLMSELCEEDCTILLATHSIEELVTLCARTLALHDGQLVFDRPTVELGRTRAEVRDTLQYLFLGSDAPPRVPKVSPSPQSAELAKAHQSEEPVTQIGAIKSPDLDMVEFETSEMEYGFVKGRAAS